MIQPNNEKPNALPMFSQCVQSGKVLPYTIQTERSPASNAMPAMFQSLIERADRLSQDLDALESQMRKSA